MDIAGVREALHKQPFDPFVICLANGRSLSVPHRDFVALGRRRIVVIGKDEGTTMLEPLLIVSLDWPPKKGKGKNGKHPSRQGPLGEATRATEASCVPVSIPNRDYGAGGRDIRNALAQQECSVVHLSCLTVVLRPFYQVPPNVLDGPRHYA
jgi:hypothetical protein